MNVTDRQTDGQTTDCCITALCVASRSKNESQAILELLAVLGAFSAVLNHFYTVNQNKKAVLSQR